MILYLFFAPLAPFIFWGLNGFLLGREYAQMVALRRNDGAGRAGVSAAEFRAISSWQACLMAVPLTIPVVNLLVPILGAATFTHLYHRLSADR